MAGFKLETWIAKTPTEVFDFACDPKNSHLVVEGVVATEVLTPGPVGEGTRIRETREMKGKRSTVELVVEKHAPPTVHQVATEVEGIRVVYRYEFSAEKGGTRVSLDCDVTARGLKRLMTPIVAKVMKREDGNHLDRLSAAIG